MSYSIVGITFIAFLAGPLLAIGDAPKPNAGSERHVSWCHGNACNKFCVRPVAGAAKVECQKTQKGVVRNDVFKEYAKKSGEPTDLVDVETVLRDALLRHPSKPCTGETLESCGISFKKGDSGESAKVRAGVIPGLVKAVVGARAYKDKKGNPADYGLYVGYAYRSLYCQTQLTCNHLGESPPCDGKTLSCPGPNIHSDGVAIDIYLTVKNKNFGKKGHKTRDQERIQVTFAGKAISCEATAHRVKKDSRLRALHEIMFATGWWNYCQEPWHFEYTVNPYSGKFRNNKIAD
ncbi:MAG: hypothetical protein HYY84_13390 [Deltaproteobacteria bacterium]|nr:hypothetical protein [Deltaproteobacteria bacterium]